MIQLLAAPAADPAVQAAAAPSADAGLVLYSSLERDPFRLAAEATGGCRSSQRIASFAQAFAHLQRAQDLFVAGLEGAAAIAVLQAYWHSEGLLELSRHFQNLFLSRRSLQLDSVSGDI